MPYSKKSVKMYVKYCKKALRFVNKMYRWKWIPIDKPLEMKITLENTLHFYENLLEEM